MNIVNPEYIKSYCLDKFRTDYRLSSSESELIIPSVFMDDDYRRHMSINLETGLWRCFKTGNTGHFIKLYSILEKIPYKKAYEKFLFESFIMEEKVVEPEKLITKLEDTGSFELVDPTKEYDSEIMAKASEFIYGRGLESNKFYVAKEGFYKDRLIIPFFNSSGKLFFFQARGLRDAAWPKYLNSKSVKASEILYPFDYESFDPLYVTEGVFDCLSLKACGLNATTTLSCVCSKAQMEQLKFYRGPIVVAYDSDAAGKKGVSQFLHMALKCKVSNIWYTKTHPAYKDWNEVLVADGREEVGNQVTDNYRILTKLDLAVSELQTSGSSNRTLGSKQ